MVVVITCSDDELMPGPVEGCTDVTEMRLLTPFILPGSSPGVGMSSSENLTSAMWSHSMNRCEFVNSMKHLSVLLAPCKGIETLMRDSQLIMLLVRVTLPTLPPKELTNVGNSIALYMLIVFVPTGDPPMFQERQ